MHGNPLSILGGRCVIHIGDVFDRLQGLPDNSVDVVVTSPPYWGLRDYDTAFWVEGDPKCDHRPVATTRTPWANRIKGPQGGRTITGFRDYRATQQAKGGFPAEAPRSSPAREIGGYCAHCGARRVDYQIGLEATLGEHIEVMVAVFAEIWRVVKPTGSVWLNYGDCYAAKPNGRKAADTKAAGNDDRTFRDKPFSTVGPIYDPDHSPTRSDPKRRSEPRYDPHFATGRGVFEAADMGQGGRGTRRVDHGGRIVAGGVLKEKDLCLIPARLAIALQEWGWWVRSEIIWGKTNAMPDSSGNQRPSVAHEKIYLLTKSAEADIYRARDTGDLSFNPDLAETCPLVTKPQVQGTRWIRIGSYYDASSVMQPSSPNTHPRLSQNIAEQAGSKRAHAGAKSNGPMKAVASKVASRASGIRNNDSYQDAMMSRDRKGRGLTPRHEGKSNHTGLPELGRGAGRLLRNFETDPAAPLTVWQLGSMAFKEAHFATFPPQLVALAIAAASPPADGVVLDPFGGAGTTAMVALRMGRKAHMIELNADYATLARRRIEQDWMGEDERKRAVAKQRAGTTPPDPGPLFSKEAAE